MKFTLGSIVVVLVISLAFAAPADAGKKTSCKDAGLVATGPEHLLRIQTATRCLINRERTSRGLKKLKANDQLLKSSD